LLKGGMRSEKRRRARKQKCSREKDLHETRARCEIHAASALHFSG
jgi:hypothetical protein